MSLSEKPATLAGITLDEVTVRYGAHIAIERASFAVRPGGVIEALIAGLKGRYTILLVTHNLAQARRLADTVAVCW